MRISIIVPTLDEERVIAATLELLAPFRARGHEVIVVDGGSGDATRHLCEGRADIVLDAPRGRARQMNSGAALASGEVLLFLHADTLPPPRADEAVRAAMQEGGAWGRFDVCIAGRSAWLRLIAALMNRRSRWTGIATGDQAMFVRRDLFVQLGGFAEQPLMEDVELSRRLRAVAAPVCVRDRVATCGRRWEAHGVWRTVWLMWRLRWRYWRGAAPDVLANVYTSPR